MIKSYFIILNFFFFFFYVEKNPLTNKEEWFPIFNGKDLTNWIPKFSGQDVGENYRSTFQVQDGLLTINYDNWSSFNGVIGHLFFDKKFSHYRLRSRYRFIGEQLVNAPEWAYRNNGFKLHAQHPNTMSMDQKSPIGVEAQLLGGNGIDERPTLNLCTGGTDVIYNNIFFTPHCTNSSSKTFHGDQWVDIEILVLGDSLFQHIIGGQVVLEYSHPTSSGNFGALDLYPLGAPIKDGYIAIQAETHSTQFSKIEILNLSGCTDSKAKNYKSYFVHNNKDCEY